MRRLAITGAAGFIGRAIVSRAIADGISVRAIVRTRPNDFPPINTVVVNDLMDGVALRDALADCTHLVHLAARVHVRHETASDPEQAFLHSNRDMAIAVSEAAVEAGVQRMVHLSSVAAVCSTTIPGAVADDRAAPEPQSLYGRSKLAGDLALAEFAAKQPISIVSLRPPTVYGPGVSAYFLQLLKCASMGLPLPIGGVNNRRSFIFLYNLVDAILRALRTETAGSFIVTDSPPLSTAALYRKLLLLFGRPSWLPALPPAIVQAAAKTALGARADSLLGSSAFDGWRFRDSFQWDPPTAMDDALAVTVRNYPWS